MRRFAELFVELDRTTSHNDKQAALVRYFTGVAPRDGAWAVALLTGRRPKKPLSSTEIKTALIEYLKIEPWLLDESYESVGDLGETVSLLIDTLRPNARVAAEEDVPLSEWMEVRIPSLKDLDERCRRERLHSWWDRLGMRQIFLLQKLIAGSFRVGASESLVLKALAEVAKAPLAVVTQRLTGKWIPTAAAFETLIASADGGGPADPAQPYPFALAYPLDTEPASLGDVSSFAAEWKWDGIRSQIVRRAGEAHIWSRGEELVTGVFPEIRDAALKMLVDGTVLDGELLVFEDGEPRPFAALQKRLGRKKVSAVMLAEAPVQFLAYDILEMEGEDLREQAFGDRRVKLERLLATCMPPLSLSPLVKAKAWPDLAAARADARTRGVEGLMLKKLDAHYRAGRRRGDWWKWKVDPLTVDAILLYAQAGSGRRANLFTDYSFAVWHDGNLVPIAKAYSGLDQAEIGELDRWIRAHTKEKFGPVRSVEPVHVFELGFEGIQWSKRHKSGVAVRFPRILRWRKDKPASEADSLSTLKALIDAPP